MKIKITDGGWLQIERGKERRTMLCPFSKGAYCGDWCPLFGEPIYDKLADEGESKPYYVIHLKLCHTTLTAYPQHFTDERPGQGVNT